MDTLWKAYTGCIHGRPSGDRCVPETHGVCREAHRCRHGGTSTTKGPAAIPPKTKSAILSPISPGAAFDPVFAYLALLYDPFKLTTMPLGRLCDGRRKLGPTTTKGRLARRLHPLLLPLQLHCLHPQKAKFAIGSRGRTEVPSCRGSRIEGYVSVIRVSRLGGTEVPTTPATVVLLVSPPFRTASERTPPCCRTSQHTSHLVLFRPLHSLPVPIALRRFRVLIPKARDRRRRVHLPHCAEAPAGRRLGAGRTPMSDYYHIWTHVL